MRIGIDGRTLRDEYPGIGRFVHNLLLAMQPQLGDDTLVILHNPGVKTRYAVQALDGQPGIEMVPFTLPVRALSQQWRLPALLRRLELDVFHSPYYFTAYRGLPCPMVLSLFDLIPIVQPSSIRSPLGRLVYRVAVRLALGAAAKVLVCSQVTQADLARIFQVPAQRVAVIPGAAAPAFSPAQADAVRRTRELHRVPPRYILHVGVNKPHKNLEVLLDAYHRYYTRTPAEGRASLVLVGEHDPRFVSPRRRAAQLGLARSVLALGSISDEDLRALYTGAACVAFPSLYEGFGLPILEAMACGAPVVASSASSLPEVAGDAAILLDPYDSAAWTRIIPRLLEDSALRESLRSRGLARAREFSWEATARATLEVYRALAGAQ